MLSHWELNMSQSIHDHEWTHSDPLGFSIECPDSRVRTHQSPKNASWDDIKFFIAVVYRHAQSETKLYNFFLPLSMLPNKRMFEDAGPYFTITAYVDIVECHLILGCDKKGRCYHMVYNLPAWWQDFRPSLVQVYELYNFWINRQLKSVTILCIHNSRWSAQSLHN